MRGRSNEKVMSSSMREVSEQDEEEVEKRKKGLPEGFYSRRYPYLGTL